MLLIPSIDHLAVAHRPAAFASLRRRTLLAASVGTLAALVGCATPASVAPVRRRFISEGVEISYLQAGEGETVVLAHGFSSSAQQQWVDTGVFHELAARYRVFALDGRGHGHSGKPHDASQYGPQAAQDAIRLLDHIGQAQGHIVGYSLGAILSGYQLTQSPERFRSCVLAGATPRFRWTAEDQRKLDIEAAEMEQGSKKSQILRLWPKDKPQPTDAQIREMSARDLAGQDHKALAASRRGGARALITPAQVAAIRVPTLGIVGTVDPYLAEFRAMKAMNPAIELVTIDGASHATAPARPELAAAILEFLERHRG